jgi:hypothetical protein
MGIKKRYGNIIYGFKLRNYLMILGFINVIIMTFLKYIRKVDSLYMMIKV